MRANRTTPAVMRAACLGGLLAVATSAMHQSLALAQRVGAEKPAMQTVTSKDGTRIAYEKTGQGPALIVVTGALAGRSGGADLAKRLGGSFTVYCYDRRGRGDSGDTKPYAVAREVEDLAAIIDAAGGSAFVYAKSSGAALALQAAATLGGKISKLAIYEAPFSDAAGAAAEWKAFTAKLDGLLAAGRRAEAVTFFLKLVGAPDDAVGGMKASPAWPAMEAMAPTLAYDNAVVGADRSVPVATAARIKTATLVMDGGASAGSMPFMRATADTLAKAVPGARRHTIEGQAHDVSAEALAPVLITFFASS